MQTLWDINRFVDNKSGSLNNLSWYLFRPKKMHSWKDIRNSITNNSIQKKTIYTLQKKL